MFALAAKYGIHPGYEDQAVELFTAFTKQTQLEPGNILYIVHRSSTNPQLFLIYELYTDKAAFDAHCRYPHFTHYVTQGLQRICKERHSEEYYPLEQDKDNLVSGYPQGSDEHDTNPMV